MFFPKPVFAVEVNPFTEKWGMNLYSRPDVFTDFSTLVMPVTADVLGDSWHEIFLSLGYDHDDGDDGVVFCLDGHSGDVLWSYFSANFGSHTCLELYDLDGDGNLELLATGYHHVVAFHAEDGSILWEFTRMNNRQDKPAVVLEEDGVVYVFTVSHQGSDGIGLQKRLGATGALVAEVAGPLHPCHGGLSCEDLDGDGEFELIVTDRNYGVGHRGLQCYDTDLNLLWSQSSVGCSSHLANIVDVNGDGIFDVVAMNQGDGWAGICVVDGSTGQPMPGKWSQNLGLYAHYTPTIYDIDQDGHLELITARDIGQVPTSVWDLETWSLDAELWRRDGFGLCKPPVIANVIGDCDMEMVFVTHEGFEMYDKNYELAGYHNQGYDGRSDRIVIQDIDDDGLNEIVAVMHEPGTGFATYAFIQCLDTPGVAPDPGARTDNFLYSLRRNGVSLFTPIPGEQDDLNIPPIAANDTISFNEDSTVSIEVLDNDFDVDGIVDPSSVVLVTYVENGVTNVNPNTGVVTYTPDPNYFGTDSFTYIVDDDQGATSNVAVVDITVYQENDPPNIPIVNGPRNGDVGEEYIFTTSTDDVEADQVYYKWDWGDGTYSGWIGPSVSGEEITSSHIWSGGCYNIMVKAKDIHDAESEWSDPLLIYISFNEFPENESTFVERPPLKLSVTFEYSYADVLDVYICWKNHSGEWIILESYINIGNGTFTYIPSEIDIWTWGNSTYIWSVNVSEDSIWTNQTYHYTTCGSRYDVNNDDGVTFQDAGLAWIHRTTEVAFIGIYDVNSDGEINFQDAGLTWINRD